MHYVPFKQIILSGWMVKSIHIVHPGFKIFDLMIFSGRHLTAFNVSAGDYLHAISDRNFLKTYTVDLVL